MSNEKNPPRIPSLDLDAPLTDRRHAPPELRELLHALGPLAEYVQLLTATAAGFMAQLRLDTPRPALEAILAEFDLYADRQRTLAPAPAAIPAPAPKKQRRRKAAA